MVRVLVRRTVVVDVEQPVIQVLVIVTTCVETRVGSVEVPVIARILEQRMSTARTGNPERFDEVIFTSFEGAFPLLTLTRQFTSH